MTNEREPSSKKYKQLYIEDSTSPNGKYTSARIGEDDYLQTHVWEKKRIKRLKIDNYVCQQCGSPVNVQVHHTQYPPVWGEENVEKHLVTLCEKCHERMHNNDRQKFAELDPF